MIFMGQSLVMLAAFLTQVSSHVLLQRRADGNLNVEVKLPQLSSPPVPSMSPIHMPDFSMHMPNIPTMQTPTMHTPNFQAPSGINFSNSDYSLSGYLSSFYNSMPGISTMTSFLRSVLSYFPSGSSIYNAIASALDAVTPDYATLKALYDQVRAQIVEDKERAYRHHLEKMKIKYGYPLDSPGGPQSMGGPGGLDSSHQNRPPTHDPQLHHAAGVLES